MEAERTGTKNNERYKGDRRGEKESNPEEEKFTRLKRGKPREKEQESTFVYKS